MGITERIVESLGQLRSLLSQKEKIMSDQTVIEPTTTTSPDATALSPAESFANEVAAPVVNASDTPVATPAAAADAIPQPAASSVTTDAPPQSSATPVDTADAIPQPVASSVATDAPPQSSASPVVTANATPQPAMAASAVNQDISASVKDFTQAFNFVEQGVEKLGVAAKDELIALARKYL